MSIHETDFTRAEKALPADSDWLTVFACLVCLFLSSGTLLLYVFGVFVRPLASDFHWQRSQVFAALVVGEFVVAVSAPLWGWLIDRFGPRRVIVPSTVGLSLAFASLALLRPHLWMLYLLYACFSLLGGGSSPVGYSAVLVRSFERRLGRALGLSLMGIGFGAALLPALAQSFVSHYSWRSSYAGLGLLTLVVTAPAAWIATRNTRLPLPNRMRDRVRLAPLMLTRAFLVLTVVLALIALASGGAFVNLIPMLVDSGATPGQAARIVGFSGVALILGRGGIGWLLDRFNAARLLALVCLIVAASLLILTFAHGRLPAAVAALLLGAVLGAEVDFTAFLVRRYFGNAAFSRLYGITFGLFALAAGVGPLLLSLTFDRLGSYKFGLLVFVACSVVAALATLAMPTYQPAESAT